MTLDGGTVQLTNGLTLCTNATLTGSTTLDGSVTNSGTIEPGSSPGSFNIAGSLVLLPGSRLRFELGGPAAGSQYDQLNISNAVTYGGTVTVQLINGFTPSAGQVFQLINAPSRLGAFAGASLPALPAGLSWINRLAVDGSIGVVGQAVPPQLLNPLVLGNGSFQFGFTHPAGASFTVLSRHERGLALEQLDRARPADGAFPRPVSVYRPAKHQRRAPLLPRAPTIIYENSIPSSRGPDGRNQPRAPSRGGAADDQFDPAPGMP